MRFFLALLFFNLLWCNHALSQKINIENKIILKVPNNFIFIEGDSKSEFIEPIIDFLGNDVKTYLIGTKDSVNFTKLYQENPCLVQALHLRGTLKHLCLEMLHELSTPSSLQSRLLLLWLVHLLDYPSEQVQSPL